MTPHPHCRLLTLVILISIAGWAGDASARDLTEATFTQVVNDVNVSNDKGADRHAAKIQSKFTSPEVVSTGANSRAELTAPDQTVTRVGANTVFSFKPEGRGINLEQGSVLFNSPHGRGGGVIQTRSATAAVLGTTIIVSATSNGGFKMLCLEGHGQVTLSNGRVVPVNAGQLTFVLPGGTGMPPVFEFRINKLVNGSNLTNGFNKNLPSQNKITDAITIQEHKIATGGATDTGLMLGNVQGDQVQLIDPNAQQEFLDANAVNFASLALSDAIINTPTLDMSRIVQFGGGLDLSGINPTSFFDFTAFDVFVAHNLTISTSMVDLAPFSNDAGFLFFSSGDTNITGDTFFANSPGFVGILSLGTINVAPGSLLEFDCDYAALMASNDLNFSGVDFVNYSGQMLLGSNSSITMFGGSVTGNSSIDPSILIQAGSGFNAFGTSFTDWGFGGMEVDAGGSVTMVNCDYNGPFSDFTVNAGSDISLTGMTVTANNINLSTPVGTISLVNGSFNAAGDINATTNGNMNITGGTYNAGNNINLLAGFGPGGTLTASGVNFLSAAQITMAAYTVVVGNGTSFPRNSIVNLYSFLGSVGGNNTPNFGSVQTGQVNFVGGSPSSVTYGGTPIGSPASYNAFNANIANAGKVNILQLP